MFHEVEISMVDVPPPNVEKHINQFKHYYMDRLDNSGVYKVDCQCDKSYIGVTKRNIKTRIKEHIRDTNKVEGNVSGLSSHLKQEKHQIKSVSYLDSANGIVERNIKEASYIAKHAPELNLDRGNIPQIWWSCLHHYYHKSNCSPGSDI